MNIPNNPETGGPFEPRYVAFIETITHLRPKLHRYCARMTGSVLDGEDVVQDALFQAYRKLDTFDDKRPLEPWLFRIAHNRCIDFLRRREVRKAKETEASDEGPAFAAPVDPPGPALGTAVEYLVMVLPPKERASILLKDVLDYSLKDVAELVGSTVGGVKSALKRGRTKLASLTDEGKAPVRPTRNAERTQLLQMYVDRFSRRDWDGVRELAAEDAHLRVADRFDGRLDESPYFGQYERKTGPWRMTVGQVDGEPVVIGLHQVGDAWRPWTIIRFDIVDGQIKGIADYWHCPWLISATPSLEFSAGASESSSSDVSRAAPKT